MSECEYREAFLDSLNYVAGQFLKAFLLLAIGFAAGVMLRWYA